MDMGTLRAWWAHRQGLDGSLSGASPADVLERCGWARSVGGVGPYLTLFSRAGTSRENADAAVAALQIHELPTARGCTYVVPANDFALGLSVGAAFNGGEMKQAIKLGVTEKEIAALCDAVVKALARGPLDPDGIRSATGSASRSLGDAGKKKGLTTTLPLALGELQSTGKIRRVPVNGRLDQQRYAYALWKPNPLSGYRASPADSHRLLAEHFFRWIGPAKMSHFQWFSGLGVAASKAAATELDLTPIAEGSEWLLLQEDLASFKKFRAPAKAQYALVSSLDPIVANRRDVASHVDAADAERQVMGEKATATLGALSDLPSHAILDRGRVVGLWEFDPETQTIAAATFVPKTKALDAAIEATEGFVRDQLGDARSFSLDSPKSRMPRIAALRKER
ncbi:MAG: crosslink repair DNA glycosylase YcaQ family protein [Gemmatimonadaceae bacterium]